MEFYGIRCCHTKSKSLQQPGSWALCNPDTNDELEGSSNALNEVLCRQMPGGIEKISKSLSW